MVTLTLTLWPINFGVLTSLLLPHLSSSLTVSLSSLNLLCYSKTDARFKQDGRKAVWSIPYVSVALWNVTPSPPHYLSLLTISLLSRPVINYWFEGVTHISLPTQEYDRGRQEKTNRRTNTNKLGVTKSRGRYATLHACAFLIADMD